MVRIGLIGGSGLDNPELLHDAREVEIQTPFGTPSSPLKMGTINGVEVVLLARHGRKHTIMPTNVNNQANIWALKEMGCTHILASTACGSLQEQIRPGDLVFLDQFIDRTTKRKQTFYESEKVCHIPLAEPFCPQLRAVLGQRARALGLPHHTLGTVITIEGPRFSSKAESTLFHTWGAEIINMSTVPEVVLAREAGICYAAIAMATDYDSWRAGMTTVTWEEVLNVFQHNVQKVITLCIDVIPKISHTSCFCREDIKTAIMGGSS